jgi:hypothetical protein
MGLQLIQKLDLQAASRWLFSHECLKTLHHKLVNVRFDAQTNPKLATKMRGLMLDIAAAEDSERAAIAAIAQVENRYRQHKQENRLQRLCGPNTGHNAKPERDEKTFVSSWLLWFLCLTSQPRLDLSNHSNG